MMSAIQDEKSKGKRQKSADIIILRTVYFHTLILANMQNVQFFVLIYIYILQIPPKNKFILFSSFTFLHQIALNAFQSIL